MGWAVLKRVLKINFSGLRVYRNHLKVLLNHRFLGPIARASTKCIEFLCARHHGYSGGLGLCSKIPLTLSCRAI